MYAVRVRRRSESLHRNCGLSGGPCVRVRDGDDTQVHGDRTAGQGPGGGHYLSREEAAQDVRPGEGAPNYERGTQEG